MKNLMNSLSFSVMILSLVLGLTGLATAQKRDDRDIRDAVRSLNSKIEDFETNLRYQMQSTSSNGDQLSEVSADIRSLRNSVQQFQDLYDRRRENRDDISAIVAAARRIDEFMRSNRQNQRVEDDWAGVRRQIDRLGTNYGITTNWNNRSSAQDDNYRPAPIVGKTLSVGLSGTYDLDAARSENVDDVITDTKLGAEQGADLKEKLTAPEQIALDIRGNQVTLATTNASPVLFTADGREKTEQSPSGKTIRMKATLTGDKLVVSSLGGETDYTITFVSESDGKVLKVSRRITTDYLNQTVFAESVYNKTDSVAQLGIKSGSATASSDPNGGYSDNDNSGTISNGGTGVNNGNSGGRVGAPSAVTSRPGNYTVPNGVSITGILDNEINTKVSQNNDRFKMTVQSPDEFRGATVEGYISNLQRSGAINGEPKVTLNFEKITLRNGQTYDFAGNLQSVQALNGKNATVDNEGTIKGESQTKQTAKRGGIGAGIGAVIGAIAGGGKGAVLGAIIGGGGGAGTVAIQGKGDIQLQQGSTITVVSSSPLQRDR
ncbi:MAG TPA: hypothetical protein PK108_15715 [Pyrinomonadaceae bacterium]|nr:hypothetical protein [Pyrinomonadaceae bacterium]HRA41988.1 hypothetical protein [Pyrinomonadaceae bacterium]